jgi:hypothetical protein
MNPSMKTLLSSIFLLLLQNSFAQFPFQKQWDYRFGGTNYDYTTYIKQTTDGGFILGGYSSSPISGDKTQPCWGQLDYWIVKLDAAGIKQWDKRFGGTDVDVLSSVEQTSDGGYILGGYSASQANGDKTQTSRGNNDYWIVKTDSLGNKIWDKRYGGASDELLAVAFQTSDGGYILGGYSGSGIGGDKTTINRGYHDYWLVRTDSIGTVLWDKDYGGTDYDFLYNMIMTSDGGFLLGGSSSSPAGPDKTQNIWGANDAWIVKTDSLGNKQWDADYGGVDYDQLNSLCQTSDGGYFLGCYSASGISGNKTQNTWGVGDVWLIRIDNAGNILWDKDYGGTDIEDGIGSVFENSDGGFYVACNSFSPISGNKSENNLGIAQAWIFKTDSLGNFLWDKTIFTDPEQKIYPLMIQTAEGCYAIAEATYGDIAGYKTQPNWDASLSSTDFWIIRYCDTTTATIASFVAPNTVCPGTCIDFTNTSVNSISYEWFFPGSNTPSSTDINPQGICYPNPGNYDVTLIATGATGISTVTQVNYITVYPVPPPQGIMQSGDTLFANPGAVTYQWYFNGNAIPGGTDYYYVATESGNYNIIATDVHGCEVEAAVFDVVAGNSQLAVGSWQLAIFPNPAETVIHIQLNTKDRGRYQVELYNSSGARILSERLNNDGNQIHELALNSSELSPGLYMVIISGPEKIFRQKIQIVHAN